MNLENFKLSERVRQKRPHAIWFYSNEMPQIGKAIGTESILVVVRGWEEEEIGNDCEQLLVSFWGDGNVMELNSGEGCTTMWRQKTMNCTH